MASSSKCLSIFKPIVLMVLAIVPLSVCQSPAAPAPASDSCNGVYLSYAYTAGRVIPPTVKTRQPHRFESTLTVLNNGEEELKSWKVFVGFQHDEKLISASNAVLADGTTLPALVGNGTVFAGYPMSDLKTAIDTAGDLTQMQVEVKLVGTQFGVNSPDVPMPTNISLANDGYDCKKVTGGGELLFWFRQVL